MTLFKWLTRPFEKHLEYIFELGRKTGRAEAKTEAIRKQLPDANVVESDNPKQVVTLRGVLK